MSYSLIFSPLFIKQLKKLSKDEQKRIISVLTRIQIRPHSYVKKLIVSPYFRLRVGEYRVILDIKNKELIIHVLEVAHRRNIYK
jgi:mRNA interferase RelE/StbE